MCQKLNTWLQTFPSTSTLIPQILPVKLTFIHVSYFYYSLHQSLRIVLLSESYTNTSENCFCVTSLLLRKNIYRKFRLVKRTLYRGFNISLCSLCHNKILKELLFVLMTFNKNLGEVGRSKGDINWFLCNLSIFMLFCC